MNLEQSPLDITRRHLHFRVPSGGPASSLGPLPESEVGACLIALDCLPSAQELPDSNIDNSLPVRFQEHQDGRRHRDAHAAQAGQGGKSLSFLARGQGNAGRTTDAMVVVREHERLRANGLPSTDGVQLPFREVAASPGSF